MDIKRHGLAIGFERTGDRFFLTLKAQGKLTHQDYLTITPLIDSALATVKDPQVNALIDGTELEGWEARAAWDDFKLGLKHGSEFKKIAVYGNKKWLSTMAKIGGWFISGEVRHFDDINEAITWLNE